LSSDANTVRRIALTGQFDLLPVRRTEELRMPGPLRDALGAVSQPAGGDELSDEMLISLLRSQDADALDVLFSRHSRLVYSIALRILRDSGEAEEVVQDCFLYVYRKALSFEPSRGSVKVWIIQMAYSRARDRKAHLTRRGFYLRTDIESDILEGTLVGNADVEREIGAKVDFDRLQCAFEDLTEMQYETLKLFYFDGLELREISERLHEPLGNIRHHFYRGLERLRSSAVVKGLRNHRHATN
jgi:RNA polymerase sigma-70 factor (ECF subfamily)